MWASNKIVQKINKDYQFNLDDSLFDISKYKIEKYSNAFLGSQGRREGKYYAGVDDFEIITPKFNTKLHLEIPSENIIKDGEFENVIIHRESLTPNDLLNKDDTAYDVYMRGNHDLVKIKNDIAKTDKTALYILDSYGIVVAPFLSQSFKRIDLIDIRSYEGSIDEYITSTQPDVVIYMITNHRGE